MTHWLLLAAFIAFSAAPVAAHAVTNQICHHHHKIENWLARQYGESPRGGGLTQRHLFQIWVNETTGTWSITRTRPNKVTCLLAAGQDWNFFSALPPGDPA